MKKIKYDKKSQSAIINKKLSEKAGINVMYENGIINFAGRYSIVYEIKKENNNIPYIFDLLRFYDIHFKIIKDNENKKTYLEFTSLYNSTEEAEEDLGILEEDLKKHLEEKGFFIKRLTINSRMELIQRMAAAGTNFINTNNYMQEGGWLEDILMEKAEEKNNSLIFGKEKKKYLKLYFLKEPENEDKIIKKIKLLCIYEIFEAVPVSDYEIKLFLNSSYLGLERILSKPEIKASAVLPILEENSKNKNSRSFTLCGLYPVVVFEEQKKSLLEEIEKELSSLKAEVSPKQKKHYQTVMPAGLGPANLTRVCMSVKAGEILQNIIERS